MRGLAVLSRLERRDPGLKAVLAAPARHARWCAAQGVELWSPPERVREKEPLATWAASLPRPRLLVADVFPRGVLGELTEVLPRLERRALLVSRRVRPRAWLAPEVRTAIEERFAEVLWCEEPPPELAPLSVPQSRLAPILSLPPAECLDPRAARDALGLTGADPVVLMLGAGSEEEQRDTLRLLLKVQGRLGARDTRFELVAVSPVLPPARRPGLVVLDDFPAMRVLRAGALVVSGGGYSAWHEARALGVPALFLPRPRSWDDQHLRVAGSDPPTTPEKLEAAIERGLRGPTSAPETGLPDGADAVAARVIEALA